MAQDRRADCGGKWLRRLRLFNGCSADQEEKEEAQEQKEEQQRQQQQEQEEEE